jgi:hypothetical protein
VWERVSDPVARGALKVYRWKEVDLVVAKPRLFGPPRPGQRPGPTRSVDVIRLTRKSLPPWRPAQVWTPTQVWVEVMSAGGSLVVYRRADTVNDDFGHDQSGFSAETMKS